MKLDCVNMKKIRNKIKLYQKKFILLAFVVISLQIIGSITSAQANPIAPPKFFNNFDFGITSENINLQHVQSLVEINVYDIYSTGNGTYLLRNHNDINFEAIILFPTGPTIGYDYEETEIHVSANDTLIEGGEFLRDGSWDEYYYDSTYYKFNVNFTSHSDVLLNIQWRFNSAIEQNRRRNLCRNKNCSRPSRPLAYQN